MTRPSASVTSTRSPTRLADGGAGAGHDVHAAAPEDVLQHGGGVRVLAGQHPVAGGDEGDLGAERLVGAGELGAGDAGADHDQLLGELVEVVDLRPVQDALAVGQRVRDLARVAAGGDQHGVGVERLLGCRRPPVTIDLARAVGGLRAGSSRPRPRMHPGAGPGHGGGDVVGLGEREPLHAPVDLAEVDADDPGGPVRCGGVSSATMMPSSS